MTSQSTDRPDLLPCPFCGKMLRVRVSKNPYGVCDTEDCYGGKMPIVNLNVPEDVAAWNRRPAPDLPRHAGEDELAGRLLEEADYLDNADFKGPLSVVTSLRDAAARISSDSALLATVSRERDEAVKAHAAACHNGAEKARRLGLEKYDLDTRLRAAESALAAARQQAIEDARWAVASVVLPDDDDGQGNPIPKYRYAKFALARAQTAILALSETKAS